MEDIERMSYQERCEALSKNVALIARNFQYRVKVSFKIIVMNDTWSRNIEFIEIPNMQEISKSKLQISFW